jgi:hypothetical protein
LTFNHLDALSSKKLPVGCWLVSATIHILGRQASGGRIVTPLLA